MVHFASLFLIFDNFYELKLLGSNGITTWSLGEICILYNGFLSFGKHY